MKSLLGLRRIAPGTEGVSEGNTKNLHKQDHVMRRGQCSLLE